MALEEVAEKLPPEVTLMPMSVEETVRPDDALMSSVSMVMVPPMVVVAA